ncbi:hypothetical protein OIU77_026510 [Salix suchowensis]|uniref:Myb/SANT-like DNA-binding domain-containing protein n=1 Tax=Salix suchowensis TaxID=1278906 RepID=A0ABQ9BP54_9ROSI|nr:hypothetical protein OIU77_026510 [Salix suchowensis]
MDKEVNRESPSLLPNNNTTIKEESPRKLFGGAGVVTGGGGGDRLKRDEWSEGAVSTLLEAYENKWILRNRAKLKGNDWEDVAHHVSSRANSTKSPKTQTQCKNKIESMKKSAAAAVTPPPQHLPMAPPHPPPPPPPHHHQTNRAAQNSHGSNGVDKGAKGDGMDAKLSDHVSDKNSMDTDSSTPAALYSDKEEPRSKKLKKKTEKRKRRKREEWEMADSIRWLAEVVVRSEQARMETMRELEKMRIEAEAKRGEMDLKRTEIIANTQLEIAKLFAGAGRAADSSVRIGKT